MRSIAVGMLLAPLLLVFGVNAAPAQGITTQQADEILKELRGIRQALERLAMQPAGRPGVATATVPPAPVRMPNITGYVLGRPDAPLTMVEFIDLQCPYCQRFHDVTFPRIKTDYIDKGLLRFLTRDFPLDFHAQSDLAARASRCAAEQDHFWDIRTVLLAKASTLTPEFITESAAAANLNMRDFSACVESPRTKEAVQRDLSEGRALGVEGTPTFIVGRTEGQGLTGVRMVGAMPFESFNAKFKELLALGAPKK